MQVRSKLYSKVSKILLVVAMVMGYLTVNLTNTKALDIGANPTPIVDIAVNVPEDYPGTFLDFKAELTQKLIAQGMAPGTFRITSTAMSIDTTNLDGWYVYDHYRDQASYNNLNLSEEQKLKQPYRVTVDSHVSGSGNIEDYFQNGKRPSAVINFNKHILSYENNGTANMAFSGYGTHAYTDFMIYPATNDSTRTFSFNMDASVINTHTLSGGGFLLNAGVNNHILNGYMLYYSGINTSTGAATLGVYKVNNYNAMTAGNSMIINSSTAIKTASTSLGSQRKVRLTVELKRDTVTVQQQAYKADGTLEGTPTTLFDGPVSIPDLKMGYNGFGPVVGYTSHGCTGYSMFQYTDLEMAYQSTAFDALKNVQYYQGADYKYFINLVGDSNDPQIPDEKDETYKDGINRMNENEIFYLSNANDGRIVTDTDKGADHLGLGAENGLYATGDDYIEVMARYIATNYIEGNKFKQNPVDSPIPLANFYLINNATGEQIMTLHKQHLVNTNTTVDVRIKDKSIPSASGAAIAQWRIKVYDPKGTVVKQSEWVTDPDDLPSYTFSKDTVDGKWNFELSVIDVNGVESKASQTYLTAFLDDVAPEIKGVNSSKSKATITLTDMGDGIDEDGITLIKDNRGSGVAAYFVTDNPNYIPTEEDWTYLDSPVHTYDFEAELGEETIVVWTKDECQNIGNKAVFKPIKVTVLDEEGDPIDEYYVIQDTDPEVDNPIIVLPEPPETGDDDDSIFSQWVDEDGEPVTPGTIVPGEDIVIRPKYTKDVSVVVYDANNGTLLSGDGETERPTITDNVAAGYSILQKVNEDKRVPTREGYRFTGWKLVEGSKEVDVTDQVTEKDGTYVLKAQWEKEQYVLKFDANGGVSHGLTDKEVEYGTAISGIISGIQARQNPTKAGYIFDGWTRSDKTTAVGNLTMPAENYTLYAKWKEDTSKYVVSFDTKGGSKIGDQAYPTSATAYAELQTPTRSGYTFDGWFYEAEGADPVEKINGSKVGVQGDHTLVAHWTPKEGTKYNVEYYVKTEEGYKKVNEATLSRTGRTEDSVAMKDTDIQALIKGVYGLTENYWYNPDNANNIKAGKITGSPTFALKLYYERFFKIEATTNTAEGGTISTVENVKEGTEPTIKWEAKEGWHVSKVVVDGVVRDKYIYSNEYQFGAIHKNHKVYVEFEKDKGTEKPEDPTVQKNWLVETEIQGCTDGTCIITPTTRVIDGSNITVEWKVEGNYKVKRVIVDGKEMDMAERQEQIDIEEIHSNHKVVVEVSKLPSIGGTQTEGQYTITVNKYNGDNSVWASPSKVLEAKESYKVEWDAGERYEVEKVYVDGEEIALTRDWYKFSGIKANHVVDIYFKEKGAEGPVEINREDYVKITTQITGGPGEITGGAIVKKDTPYEVNWEIPTNALDPEEEGYAYYEVESVEVDGKKIEDTGEVNFAKLDKDTEVRVNLKPVLYNVTTYRYGQGTISQSKILYKGQSYTKIEATPAEGYVIKKIVVDEKEHMQAEARAMMSMNRSNLLEEKVEVSTATEEELKMSVNNIAKDHEVMVYFAKVVVDEDGQPKKDEEGKTVTEELPEEGQIHKVTAVIKGATGTVTGTGLFDEGEETAVEWTDIPEGYEVVKVTVNGKEEEVEGNRIDFKGIQEGKEVEITVAKKRLSGDERVPVKDDYEPPVCTIETEILGGAGTITGKGIIAKGGNYKVEWTITEDENHKYKIKDVLIDGKSVPGLVLENGELITKGGEYIFESIEANHKVTVVIGEVYEVNVDVDGDGIPDINIDTNGDGIPDVNIDTDGDGEPDINIDTDNTGEWKPSSEGGNKDKIWKPDSNVDKGNGELGTDRREPIDEDGDGVDDRWVPEVKVYPDGEIKPGYGTTKSDWEDPRPEAPADPDPEKPALPGEGKEESPIEESKDKPAVEVNPSQVEKPQEEVEMKVKGEVKTGDSSKTMEMAMIMAGAILCIGMMKRRRKEAEA